MSGKLTPMGEMTIESLNENAAHHYARRVLLSRRPSTPSFWFAALAIDAHVLGSRPMLELLNDEARCLLWEMQLQGRYRPEIAKRNHWCTCEDNWFNGRFRVSRCEYQFDCLACFENRHDDCPHECSWEGVIHYPETVMETRAAA